MHFNFQLDVTEKMNFQLMRESFYPPSYHDSKWTATAADWKRIHEWKKIIMMFCWQCCNVSKHCESIEENLWVLWGFLKLFISAKERINLIELKSLKISETEIWSSNLQFSKSGIVFFSEKISMKSGEK